MKMNPYTTVDEYLDNFSGETRQKLDTLRKMIKEIAPESGEKISYGIPTFTLNDKYFIYFGGYETHIALYPLPHNPGETLQKELQSYISGKGTLRFPIDKPLPLDIIRKVIQAKYKDRLEAPR